MKLWALSLSEFLQECNEKFSKHTKFYPSYNCNFFAPFALETYGAMSDRSDRFLVECATLAPRECGGSRPSISLLCTWLRQRVSIVLQRSLAHAVRAGTLRLEESMALLPPPPPRAPLSSSELLRLADFNWYDRHTFLSFLGYVVSL